MKQFTPLLLGLLHMAGCSVGKPLDKEAAAIEAVTAGSACVGDLYRWHREFAFQKRGNRIDPNLITVTYIQAGHMGLPAGRFLTEPAPRTFIDDSQHRSAGGDFDRRSHRFVWWECGCNRGPFNVDHPVECKSGGV